MRLTSATRYILVLFFMIFSCSVWCQTDRNTEDENPKADTTSRSVLDYGVKGSFGLSYYIIRPTGDKFVGLAYEGKGAYALTFKLYVYDGFFIGGSSGSSYFENTNPILTGNYDKTRVGSHYFFLGYDYRLSEKIAVGVSKSVLGEARYKNEYKGGNEAFQIDKAKLRAFKASVDYFIAPNLSINLSYMYRNDKTKIRTSSNLQSRFDRAQFSNFGIGINFQFGKEPVISGLKK